MIGRRRDRAGEKVRGQAFRLAFAKTCPTGAAIEAHLIQAGWAGATLALIGEHTRLDRIINAERAGVVGASGMFILS